MAEIIAFPERRRHRPIMWDLVGALAANFFVVIMFALLGFEIFRP